MGKVLCGQRAASRRGGRGLRARVRRRRLQFSPVHWSASWVISLDQHRATLTILTPGRSTYIAARSTVNGRVGASLSAGALDAALPRAVSQLNVHTHGN
jgi:hypothetical protein